MDEVVRVPFDVLGEESREDKANWSVLTRVVENDHPPVGQLAVNHQLQPVHGASVEVQGGSLLSQCGSG